MIRLLSFLAIAALPLLAQPIGVGFKVGLPLNDVLRTSTGLLSPIRYITEADRKVYGPYLEIHLPAGLGIEADALYRSVAYRQSAPNVVTIGDSSIDSWEFPVTLKVRFATGTIRPYVEGGVVYGRVSEVANIFSDLQHKSNFGLVGGGGIEFKFGPLRIAPGARYNGWTTKTLQNPAGLLETVRSQWTFTAAIGF